MDGNQLPTDVDALRKLLLKTQQELATSQQSITELSATVTEQEQKLAAKEQQILELIKALRGKQRERIDPAQLFLFELGELEQIIEEQLSDPKEEEAPRRRKKPHGRRLIPDELPPGWEQETIEYEVPEEERLCRIDGRPMQAIR